MSNVTYEIHAWRKDGPAYVRRETRPGFSNRRNRFSEEEVGKRGGRSTGSPDFFLLESINGEVWAFNKGHEYTLDSIVDGLHEISTYVDARDSYQTITVPEGIEIVEIRHIEAAPEVGDDEDNPPNHDEVSSDEEE